MDQKSKHFQESIDFHIHCSNKAYASKLDLNWFYDTSWQSEWDFIIKNSALGLKTVVFWWINEWFFLENSTTRDARAYRTRVL